MRAILRSAALIGLVGAMAGGALIYSVVARGLSTRATPSAVEKRLALAMRYLATPRDVRALRNPVTPTAAVLDESLEHFADHCASCHANDGSGSTAMGRSFYPPVSDLRDARTQTLTDGELFSIIEHGIRLTGMPAWGTGTPEGERSSWGLVLFIRQLASLTSDQIDRMASLNPRTARQFRAEEDARRFLAGEDLPRRAPEPTPHAGPHE